MFKRPSTFDPAFLAASESAARKVRDEGIARPFSDQLLIKRLVRLVDDPFLRPIAELLQNGATSFEGGLILKERGFLDVREFVARAGPLEGEMIEIVRLTDEARLFHEEASELPEHDEHKPFDAFEAFVEGVTGYLAIDRGNGIVVNRDLAEVALDFDDGDILNRLMSLKSYRRQLLQELPQTLTADRRMEYKDYWSGPDAWERHGAEIVDLAHHGREKSKRPLQ